MTLRVALARRVIRLVLAGLLAWLPGSLVAAETQSNRALPPNILFILSDDHRADGIGALGNPVLKTPALDRLVEQGLFFSRTYVMGSTEGAVCMPSRCMIQTGRSLFRLPRVNMRQGYPQFAAAMKDRTEGRDWALLPRVLAARGYDTFHIGKQGNECRPAIECYDTNIIRNDSSPEERRLSSQAHADRLIEFLRARTNATRPFFIYCAPPVPHDPRIAPKEFMDLYDPAKVPLPPAFMPVHPFDNGEMTVRDEKLAPWPRTPDVIRRQLADYYACITCLDHHLGRVFDCLEQTGQADRTIVIFAGDNGLSLGEHGLMGKQNLYELGGMHVPLVFTGPGIRHGRSDAFVYLYDVFATLCDLTGAPLPPSADSRSLVPLLTGKSATNRDCIFTAYKNCQRAVRTDRWKLIRYPLINRAQLFDLQTDPHELNDLAANPAFAGRLKEMTALLERQQKEFGDTAPLTVPNPKPAAWTPPAQK